MRMHRWYTPEEIQFVKKNIKGRSYVEMVKIFNKRFGLRITLKQMETLLYKHGLRNGIGSYKPGHVPFSKGKKMGHRINYSNYKPLGSERVLEFASCNKKYVEVKTDHLKWDRKHAVIWKKAYGKIPKGHVVIFADGNNRNFDLDNLMLVSRAELAVMNNSGLISNHKELTRIGKTVADIKLIIGERKRRNKKAADKKILVRKRCS